MTDRTQIDESRSVGGFSYVRQPSNSRITAEELRKWKEMYRNMRTEGRTILDEVRSNPIDVKDLDSSFDLERECDAV